MKLHYHPASTTSRIVELFVRDQGIDLEYQLVDLFTVRISIPTSKVEPDLIGTSPLG